MEKISLKILGIFWTIAFLIGGFTFILIQILTVEENNAPHPDNYILKFGLFIAVMIAVSLLFTFYLVKFFKDENI